MVGLVGALTGEDGNRSGKYGISTGGTRMPSSFQGLSVSASERVGLLGGESLSSEFSLLSVTSDEIKESDT